jgi:hypothetical protein
VTELPEMNAPPKQIERPEPVSTRDWFQKTSLASLLAFLLLAGGPGARAEIIRVVRWDLRTAPLSIPSKSLSEADRIQFAADALKALKPDVILLQHVRDWDMSSRLTRGLQPAEYRVLVCSAFPEAKSAPAGEQQVAILSRRKAYFTWSEAWQTPNGSKIPGGLAFAAIEAGRQRLGIFSVQIEGRLETALSGSRNSNDGILANACLQQWQNTLDSYKKWEANRLEAIVVSGTLTSGSEPGMNALNKLANEFIGAPLEQPLSPMDPAKDYFSARLPVNPNALSGVVMTRSPMTCDVNLDSTNPSFASIVDSGSLMPGYAPGLPEGPLVAATATSAANGWWNIGKNQSGLLLVGISIVFGFLLLLLVWRAVGSHRRLQARLESSRALQLSNSTLAGNSGTFVISSSVSGSAQDERQGASGQPLILIDSPAKTETQPPAVRSLQKEALANPSLREQLSTWLKQKLVRRLISDRADLLKSQQLATMKVMAVDERLSRIEAHLSQQNRVYELRIEELNRELLATKQENRALIHAKIVQVKAEMEAAKARIMAAARDVS